jgi:hypothetical protein
MRLSLLICLLVALLAGCAAGREPLARGPDSPDTLVVMPTRNLAGVPLKVPELYLGDAVGKAGQLDVRNLDLAELAEAAVFARLSALGFRVELEQNAGRLGTPARYEVHSAVTLFDMDNLRATGRYRMGILVVLVDSGSQREVARGYAEHEFQLLDVAPDEAGVLGPARFIESRLQIYTESLAGDAVDDGGF